MHWANKYIGIPWKKMGRGPSEYNCWTFFQMIQREHFGIEVEFDCGDVDADNLREIAKEFKSSEERGNWPQVNEPLDGDAVLMAHASFPTHIGTWLDIDGGGVLHCVRGSGVVFSNLTELKFSGWGKVEYFRHASNN